MASKRALPTIGLFLALLVLFVLYFTRSKMEYKVPKVLKEMPSKKEDFGFTPDPFQTLTNGNTSLSYAEKLLKLYDGVETFVMFIGYPRSSHSLVSAMLDAHPEIIIPHEYHVLQHWKEYSPSNSKINKNLSKYHLFYELHQLSRQQALFGLRSERPNGKTGSYNYNVPGLWQGGYQTRLKVIGDKRGGATSMILNRLGNVNVLQEIHQVVQVPMKFIHVHRNPFDNIATILLRATKSRDAVREEGVKTEDKERLDGNIEYYFNMAAGNQLVREQYGTAVLDIPTHEIVLRPKETLKRLCDHLGVTCSEDYFEKCSKTLYGTPSVTRDTVVWTEEQKERITERMKKYPFLKEYSFDKYPV